MALSPLLISASKRDMDMGYLLTFTGAWCWPYIALPFRVGLVTGGGTDKCFSFHIRKWRFEFELSPGGLYTPVRQKTCGWHVR